MVQVSFKRMPDDPRGNRFPGRLGVYLTFDEYTVMDAFKNLHPDFEPDARSIWDLLGGETYAQYSARNESRYELWRTAAKEWAEAELAQMLAAVVEEHLHLRIMKRSVGEEAGSLI